MVPAPRQMMNVSAGSWLCSIVRPPGSTIARLDPNGVRSIASHGYRSRNHTPWGSDSSTSRENLRSIMPTPEARATSGGLYRSSRADRRGSRRARPAHDRGAVSPRRRGPADPRGPHAARDPRRGRDRVPPVSVPGLALPQRAPDERVGAAPDLGALG